MKKKASGSSFYLAMRLMPAEERDAMFAIYAFCRKVDDIADDGVGTRAERHEKLEAMARRSARRFMPARSPPQVRFLAPAVAQYGLRLEDFLAVLDGMDMDVAEDIVAPDLATLDLYCDRVASAVGRLSIKVFGMEEGPGFELAHHLGRALQLTNILRDIDEDAAIGRLYLPREYLEAMDCCRSLDPDRRSSPAARSMRSAARWPSWRIIIMTRRSAFWRRRPKGRIKTPRLMGAVYSEILRASEAQGFAPPRRRVSLPKRKLLSLVLRQGLFS